MNYGDSKPNLKQQEKQKMLDELESLSRLLDEEEQDGYDEQPSRPIPEDIPVLKSFVDDVPVLSERFEEDFTPPPPPQISDSVDKKAASFQTSPAPSRSGRLDDSFLDKDPLEISAAVREHKMSPSAEMPVPNERVAPARTPEAPKPAPPVASAPVPPVMKAPPKPAAPTVASRPAEPIAPPPRPAPAAPIPPATSASFMPRTPAPTSTSTPGASSAQPASTTASTPTAASVTQPLQRFQTSSKSENPFLPRSTLEKIRESHQRDASAELRKLLETNPLQKLSFDMAPNSKEYQALRQKASHMVNDVIRANMPRLEAELRLKLEQEVDRMFKELKKK